MRRRSAAAWPLMLTGGVLILLSLFGVFGPLTLNGAPSSTPTATIDGSTWIDTPGWNANLVMRQTNQTDTQGDLLILQVEALTSFNVPNLGMSISLTRQVLLSGYNVQQPV